MIRSMVLAITLGSVLVLAGCGASKSKPDASAAPVATGQPVTHKTHNFIITGGQREYYLNEGEMKTSLEREQIAPVTDTP